MKSFNGYKKCSTCDCILPIIMFDKNKCDCDGLTNICKDCRKEYRKINKEDIDIYNGVYYKNNREKILKRYENDREHNLEIKHIYYERNKDMIYKKNKEYRHTDEGKITERRIKAKRRGMSFIPIMKNPFPEEIEVEWHHMNKFLVLPLPKNLHRKSLSGNHFKNCEEIIYKIFGLNLGELFRE